MIFQKVYQVVHVKGDRFVGSSDAIVSMLIVAYNCFTGQAMDKTKKLISVPGKKSTIILSSTWTNR
jgi:hypothetical protein